MKTFLFRVAVGMMLAVSSMAAPLSSYFDAACNCYRNVPYGGTSWKEPTLDNRVVSQVMDVWLPTTLPVPGELRPVAFYGHANGSDHVIEKGSQGYALIVSQFLAKGYVFVSYEFRHPVTNARPGVTPRLDIQKAIEFFATDVAPDAAVKADPNNTFILGRSRGGGLGILTGLSAEWNVPGITVRAMMGAEAQTTYNCAQIGNTFVIKAERQAFIQSCWLTTPRDAGSALSSVTASAPPVLTRYSAAFFNKPVPAAQYDVHHPDQGLELCDVYASTTPASCQAEDRVIPDNFWLGVVDFFESKRFSLTKVPPVFK